MFALQRLHATALCWFLVALFVSQTGLAQESDADAAVIPPRVLHAPLLTFPESARQEGLTEGIVRLKLTVRLDGKVEDVEVAEPAGHGFDEAARAAALDYVFEPAQRSGQATAARIVLEIVFRAPVEDALTPVAHPVAPGAHDDAPSAHDVAPSADDPAPTVEATTSENEEEIEVVVQGYSEADRLRRSAEAVHVVETKEAKRHTQDLGEVLARTQGVGVQRSSGLGSDTRVSMNGLTDDQIRFFLDGIPLDFMGYPFGLANVPVNLVDRVEIYRGVVPVRFGADALGGAINLVSDRSITAGTHGAASLQVGSFDTYRATVTGHHLDEQRGWLTRVGAFLDLAQNDYPMDIVVPDQYGQDVPARVYRFHDAYQAVGGNVEVGVVEKPWAKRLTLRGFVTGYDKEVQHNLLMTFNPYGDVEYGQFSAGGTARYEHVFLKQLSVSTVAGYAYRHISYTDLGECHYNWFAQCYRERGQPGERVGRPQDQDYWEHNVYGRMNFDWRAHPAHALHLSLSPTYTERSGVEHRLANPDARDPLSAERKLGGLVSGLEYQLDLFDRRFENRLFVKDYLQVLRSEDPLSNGMDFRREDRTTHRVGMGNALRYALLESLYAKASYEWSTRLPRADEIFGNAFPIQPNLELEPELSHNVNLGVTLDSWTTVVGETRADLNAFLRDTDNLIRLVGGAETSTYQNVSRARSLGVEGALGWTSPREYVSLDGNVTYVDFRNTAKEGPDADYAGDRIPNRPYFFATGSARLQLSDFALARDELSLTWTSRYVHSYLRGWESIGTGKSLVPEQLLHSLAMTYFYQGDAFDLSFSSEIQNLTDAEAYDYFGVPKPGRAFYFKMTTSL